MHLFPLYFSVPNGWIDGSIRPVMDGDTCILYDVIEKQDYFSQIYLFNILHAYIHTFTLSNIIVTNEELPCPS